MTAAAAATFSGRRRDHACSCINFAILAAFFLIWMPILVTADLNMLVFPLTRTNTSNSVDEYAMQMRLGPAETAQSVYLLPVLYSAEVSQESLRPLFIPAAELCLDQKRTTDEWNRFIYPGENVTINTSEYLVKWTGVFTNTMNLSLRNGTSGKNGNNVTVLASMRLSFLYQYE